MVHSPKSMHITSSDQVDSGVLLASDLNNSEFNVADKLVKLDGSGDVPIAQISDTLAKDAASGIPSLTADSEISPHNTRKGVSDTLRNSHDTERTTPNNEYSKQLIMTFTNRFIGNARVKMDLKTNNATYPCYARVYKNEAPLGTEVIEPSTTYQTDSEDLTLDMAAGDTLEVWLKSGGAGVSVFVENFRLYYDDNPAVAVDVTNSTP